MRSTTGIFSNTEYVRAELHPVTRQLDWRNVNVLDARRVNPPNWLRLGGIAGKASDYWQGLLASHTAQP